MEQKTEASKAVDEPVLPHLPRAVGYLHTMDNTEGIKGNQPWRVFNFIKRNPFGKAGLDYSASYPVTNEALFTASQMKEYARAALKAQPAPTEAQDESPFKFRPWSKEAEMMEGWTAAEKAREAAAQPDRRALQAEGTHPAPCGRHCEATAFRIETRRLEAENAQLRAAQGANKQVLENLEQVQGEELFANIDELTIHRFEEWFESAYPMVAGRRPKFLLSTVMDLMLASWVEAFSTNAGFPDLSANDQSSKNLPKFVLRQTQGESLAQGEDSARLYWKRITAPGQVKVGDKLRFTIGDVPFNERVKQIINEGRADEELIYNKRRNFYVITSNAITNFGSSKNIEFLARASAETGGVKS